MRAEVMEEALTTRNIRQLFRLIRLKGKQENEIKEYLKQVDASSITLFNRWTEYLKANIVGLLLLLQRPNLLSFANSGVHLRNRRRNWMSPKLLRHCRNHLRINLIPIAFYR